jgi:hypothetical protein
VVRAHLLGGDGPAGAGAPHSAISAPAAPEKGYAAKDSP